MTRISDAVEFIKSKIGDESHDIGVVLGSGLGSFVNDMLLEAEILYSDIPHFPVSTVEGHSGKLIFGKISGKKVIAMSGRFHFYEGYSVADVVFPIRVMKFLGVHTILISNAAGGTGDGFKVGDLMTITDHISFFAPNPLIGKNNPELGQRFPDMSEPYSKDLIAKVDVIASKAGYNIQHGVYVGVTGPTFETKAEYRLIHALGGHAVGMSTVQEVIAAVHMGMKVFAMSVITDLGIREDDTPITHEEVLIAAKESEPKLSHIFKTLIADL